MKNLSKKDFNETFDFLMEYYEDEEYQPGGDEEAEAVHITAKLDDNKNSFTLEIEHDDVRTVINGEYGGNGVTTHDVRGQDIVEILNVLLALGDVDDLTTY